MSDYVEYVVTPLPELNEIDKVIEYLVEYGEQLLYTNEKRFYEFTNAILDNDTAVDLQLETYYLNALSKIPIHRVERVYKKFVQHSKVSAKALRHLLGQINWEQKNYSSIVTVTYELTYSDLKDWIMEHPHIRNYESEVLAEVGVDSRDIPEEWTLTLITDLALPPVNKSGLID